MTGSKNQPKKERFASRWSRRKQRVELEQYTPGVSPDDSAAEIARAGTADTEAARAEQVRLEKLARLNALKDEDMPDISSLNEDSDFSQFMSNNVSEALRKLALRKLFLGKTYNIRDGLDEYDGDYTHFEKLDPGTITADMKYRQELDAQRQKKLLEKEQMQSVEALPDDEPAVQDALDDTADEQGIIEDKNVAESGEKLEQAEERSYAHTDIKQLEHEQATAQIAAEANEENQR